MKINANNYLPKGKIRLYAVFQTGCSRIQQKVLGRTNLPTFPMAIVAIVTLAKDCM